MASLCISQFLYARMFILILQLKSSFILTGYMYRSSKIILRESDRPHIKYDEKSENNVIKNVCEMMI